MSDIEYVVVSFDGTLLLRTYDRNNYGFVQGITVTNSSQIVSTGYVYPGAFFDVDDGSGYYPLISSTITTAEDATTSTLDAKLTTSTETTDYTLAVTSMAQSTTAFSTTGTDTTSTVTAISTFITSSKAFINSIPISLLSSTVNIDTSSAFSSSLTATSLTSTNLVEISNVLVQPSERNSIADYKTSFALASVQSTSSADALFSTDITSPVSSSSFSSKV